MSNDGHETLDGLRDVRHGGYGPGTQRHKSLMRSLCTVLIGPMRWILRGQ